MYQTEFTLETILTFLKNYPGCLFLKDADARYVYASEVCEHVNRGVTGGILGKNELEVQKDKKLGEQYYEEDRRLLRNGGNHKCYSEFRTEQRTLYYEINKSAVQDKRGNIIGIIGTVVDATREYEMQKQLREQFITDVVTGVYNNKYLELWQEDEKIEFPFTVIACDCNFLKRVNDTFGHEYGDRLLKNVGELFLENLPEKCVPVRVGGDEFLILCNDTTKAEAEQLIDLLEEKAKSRYVRGNRLSIAYGSCTMSEGEMTFDTCRNYADVRMYEAKRKMKEQYLEEAGRANIIYNEEILRKIVRQMPVVVFFKDTECRYRYLNSYDERTMKNGNEMNYGIGHTDLELQRDRELGEEFYKDDLRILETGVGSNRTREIPVDDRKRYYQITKSAVRDDTDRIIGIVGIVMDVTATKTAKG